MYAYSWTVEYHKYSSTTSAMHPEKYQLFQSVQDAKFYADQEAERLASFGTTVRKITVEKFCVNCDGRGTIITKSGKRVIRRKESTCPDCNGAGTDICISDEVSNA